MIILLCGRDQSGLNVHSVDPDSMRIESWSRVDRPLYTVSFSFDLYSSHSTRIVIVQGELSHWADI